MFQKGICMTVLLSFLALLWVSCSEELVEPVVKITSEDVTVGEIHNKFVSKYLARVPERKHLTREKRVQAYVEVAMAVCDEENFDYEPTQSQMDEFLHTCESWRESGIWDIFNPGAISPDEALDKFVTAGVIPAEHAPYLHQLIEELQQHSTGPRGLLSCTAAPCAEMETAKILLESSCQLWYDQDELLSIPVELGDDPELAKWWKTVIKYLGVGACDGLAGMAAFYAFAGNPFATGFFGGIASVAAYDAFDERGW